MFASFIAIAWTSQWPWWAYYLSFFPATFGYSIFLCVQLGKSNPTLTIVAIHPLLCIPHIGICSRSVALISAVDSRSMPKATALLYTVRTLGVTMGVSIGGSIQIGSLAMNLRKVFADRRDREQVSFSPAPYYVTDSDLAGLVYSAQQSSD